MRIEHAETARPHVVFQNRDEVRGASELLCAAVANPESAEFMFRGLKLLNVGKVEFAAVELLYRASGRAHERAGLLRALVSIEHGYADSYSLPAVTFGLEEA